MDFLKRIREIKFQAEIDHYRFEERMLALKAREVYWTRRSERAARNSRRLVWIAIPIWAFLLLLNLASVALQRAK
jgi:hypothetical protein